MTCFSGYIRRRGRLLFFCLKYDYQLPWSCTKSSHLLRKSMKPGNRRKIFLINPRLQYSFLGFSLLMSLISIAVFYIATLYLFWKFEQTGYSVGIAEGHIFYRFIADQRSLMNTILLIAAPVITIATCFIGIKLSHRVAGPIYNMTKHLKNINENGEIKEIKFRENDYFLELENEFNNFIKNSNKK